MVHLESLWSGSVFQESIAKMTLRTNSALAVQTSGSLLLIFVKSESSVKVINMRIEDFGKLTLITTNYKFDWGFR